MVIYSHILLFLCIMNLQQLKQKALALKDKTVNAGKEAIDYSASKLSESKLTLKTKEDLEAFIQRSANTKGKDSKTGEEKIYAHKNIILFADTKSDFFKKMLYMLPVLSVKAFSQNIEIKLADSTMKDFDKNFYGLTQEAGLLIFENTKHIKTINGEENIQKVVKSLSLDINNSISSL